jgi:molybdopterin-guanine dinucleotide biosynthesis protein A
VAEAFDTIVLAGGAGARLGGADKPALTVGGTPMLVTVARAAYRAGASRLIVVGPRREGVVGQALAGLGVSEVQEEPPGGGPVPALRRGLAQAAAPWLVLLAADLPFLDPAQIIRLLAAAQAPGATDPASADPGAAAGAVFVDTGGRPQWLAGAWAAGALRSALAAYQGSSLRGLLAPLRPVPTDSDAPSLSATPPEPGPWFDCDTAADLATARLAWLASASADLKGEA